MITGYTAMDMVFIRTRYRKNNLGNFVVKVLTSLMRTVIIKTSNQYFV